MLQKNIRTFHGKEVIEYTLEPKDFDYIANEFNAVKDSLGINLISKKDPKLSILLRKYGIYYDRDISGRRMMIATERVDVRVMSLLSKIDAENWYQKYIPNTTEQLAELVDEFKYKPMGTVSEDDVVNFLQKDLVV
jgi:hypothetical protein